jgi:voltage-gated potassium channel
VTWKLKPIYASFLAIFLLGALAISYYEKLSYGDALYFTFVTALTVGYGDISPQSVIGRFIAIFLALVGLTLTGVMVASAVQVVKYSFEKHERKIEHE